VAAGAQYCLFRDVAELWYAVTPIKGVFIRGVSGLRDWDIQVGGPNGLKIGGSHIRI